VAIHPLTIWAEEDRTVGSFADGEIDRAGGPRCERDGDDLAALTQDRQRPVTSFDTERVDVSPQGFGDPQPVDSQQRDHRMLLSCIQAGGHEKCAHLVAVQPDGV
jgi:hypothetical protein